MNYGTPIVNRGGIAILDATAINVGTDAVTYTVIAPNTRCVPVRGLILVNIDIEIPAGTTDTLPINLSLLGFTSPITNYGGDPLTVADFNGTGFYMLYYDRTRGVLQLIG